MTRKRLVKLDADVFQKQPGDPVRAGEVLGQSGGEDVLALSAGEILLALAGSVSLVITIPVTAFLGSWLYTKELDVSQLRMYFKKTIRISK